MTLAIQYGVVSLQVMEGFIPSKVGKSYIDRVSMEWKDKSLKNFICKIGLASTINNI